MAVKIPLKMSDGAVVRTIEDLREHFDLEAVLGYYSSGRLAEWLEERYCEKEAAEVRNLEADAKDFNEMLCAVLGVTYEKKADDKTDLSHVRKKNERLDQVKKYTMNDEILSAVDWVAFTQEELDSLLKKIKTWNENEKRVIYLCGENFVIPTNIENITYIGINNPLVQFDEGVIASDIDLQDLQFDISDYVKDCSWGMMHDVFENNLSLGLKLLRQEADQGNADAQFVFGLWCCGDDEIADMTEDVEPMEWWQKAADQGHIDANVFLCHFFLEAGLGEEEGIKAVKWFEKAVEQNSLYSGMAYEGLGQCYMQGIGVEQDYEEAVKWLKRAVDQDDVGAKSQYYLGCCYYFGDGIEQDYEEAEKWFQKAAEQGNARAQCRLGACYETGDGIQQNYKEAVKWYRKAAEQDDGTAQDQLGRCYYAGVGVEQNYTEAAKWFRKSAEQGNMTAQNILGFLYSGGLGVESSFLDAVKWYRRAAEQGEEDSQDDLEECCGDYMERDEEIVGYYRKATEQNDAEAQCYLGSCYENGNGTEIDMEEAKEWYSKAVEQGNADAQNGLFRCNGSILTKQAQEFADSSNHLID